MIRCYCEEVRTSYSKAFKQLFCVIDINAPDFCRMVSENKESLLEMEKADRLKLIEFLQGIED